MKGSFKRYQSFGACAVLAIAVLFSGVRMSGFTASAAGVPAEALAVLDGGITIDHNLSEWTGAKKNYFNGSTTDYFQLYWSENNRLYFAVTATDPGKTRDGINCDQVRLAMTLPTGETGTAMFGADTTEDGCWTSVDPNEMTNWWGENGLASLFNSGDSFAMFTWADGKAYVEGYLSLAESYKPALSSGKTLGFSIRYYNDIAVNSHTLNADGTVVKWGNDTTEAFTGDLNAFGEVYLKGAPLAATAIGISDDKIDVLDHSLSEWTDVPKNYFIGSETDYFQLYWSENRLYFAVTATDPGKTRDGINCDQVRLAITLPSGETGAAMFGADESADDCWTSVDREEIARWWGETELTSLFYQADNYARFTWADGKAYAEGVLNLNDSYKSVLATGQTFAFSIRYYNDIAVNSHTLNAGGTVVKWGNTTDAFTGNLNSFGKVTLTGDGSSDDDNNDGGDWEPVIPENPETPGTPEKPENPETGDSGNAVVISFTIAAICIVVLMKNRRMPAFS